MCTRACARGDVAAGLRRLGVSKPMSVGVVRGFLEGSKIACSSPSISLMALLSQSPGVCVSATCYMLYGSEM